MADCERCGNDNRPGARFCGVCGNPLEARPSGKAVASGKSAATPVVVAPPTQPARTASASPRPAWLIPVALAALAIVVGGAVGLSLAGGGEDTATDASADDPSSAPAGDDSEDSEDRSDPVADEEEPDEPEAEPPETIEPPAEAAVRTGYLYSNFAKLRTGPHIGNPEITTLTREGASLQIIGRQQNGWYDIRMDGSRGWIFGAFVTPPPSGFRIIQSSGGDIVLRDRTGLPVGITNESGPKALATGSAGNLWEVILPDGRSAYVLRNDVFVAAG